ncbi:ribosomal protein S18-alanine N-acetyltransferase [Alkalibacterium iburiense]|uniref:Ribosomal protein S18-alanine N-acetyltransferase n=1 Tax=Alkalibacterium iburiense TaxID=290589 RepID=A0ABN0X6B7_9LACT
MKNFKEWFTDKVSKQTTKVLVPLKMRMKLQQPFYALTDERFLKAKVAEDEDVDSIVIIERLCYNGQTPWTRSAIMHEIRYNKNAFYIVVYDEDQPVAFIGAWFVDGEAHITNIATIPDYQNKGIASYLIKEIIALGHAEDMKKLTLEVRVSNHTAQSLYRTLGFKDGKIKKNYYANDYEDALEMTLPLYPPQGDISEWK